MTEFASIVGGQIHKIKNLDARPPDIPHKGVVWLPVLRVSERPDPVTEVSTPEAVNVDIPGDLCTITRGKRSRTAQELDDVTSVIADRSLAEALALVLLDEFNVTRSELNETRAALRQLAVNNPALDTTGIAPSQTARLPDRTVLQLRAAIKTKLGG